MLQVRGFLAISPPDAEFSNVDSSIELNNEGFRCLE